MTDETWELFDRSGARAARAALMAEVLGCETADPPPEWEMDLAEGWAGIGGEPVPGKPWCRRYPPEAVPPR